MPQSLKQIKDRMRSISNTHKVTSAMQLVSAAKLSRVDKQLFSVRPYVDALRGIVSTLSRSMYEAGFESEYLRKRDSLGRIILVVVTSDAGLCGSYNSAVIRAADDFIAQHGKERIQLVLLGKRGHAYYYKRGMHVVQSFLGHNGRFTKELCDALSTLLIKAFLQREAGQVFCAFTHFQNALTHTVRIEKFLELEPPAAGVSGAFFEPDLRSVFASAAQAYFRAKVARMLLNSFASEHAARTVSMQMATENAQEILHTLDLIKNKIRKARITEELMTVIASSEALKG